MATKKYLQKWAQQQAERLQVLSRQLDARVARYVMGMPKAQCEAGPLPSYSTDIGAAWAIVEHLSRKKYDVTIMRVWEDHPKCTGGKLTRQHWEIKFDGEDGVDWNYEFADTAPLAICLAALRVVGFDDDVVRQLMEPDEDGY